MPPTDTLTEMVQRQAAERRGWVAGIALAFLMSTPLPAQVQGAPWKPDGIWRAACVGKLAEVKQLVMRGVSINARDKRGYTPLMHALNTFQTKIIAELLAAGAVADVRDYDGVSALFLACQAGDDEAARLLLAAGARLENADPLPETSAFAAALRSGSPQLVEQLLKSGASLRGEVQGSQGRWPALVYAARVSSADVVEVMVKHGADVNTPCRDKSTALLHAAAFGNLAVIKRLMALGADSKIEDARGANALFYTTYFGNEPAFKLLLDAGVPPPHNPREWLPTVFHWGNAGLLAELAAKGVEVPSREPALTLAEAARSGDLAKVDREIELSFPKFRPEAHCVLFSAAASGNVKVIERINQFAGQGAHMLCGDAARCKQLHHAVMSGDMPVLQYYLAHEVDVNATNFLGHTPLMLAAMTGRADMIESLAKAGANLKVRDRDGRNALDLARSHQQGAAMAWLEKAGLQPSPDKHAPDSSLTDPPPPSAKTKLSPLTAAALPFGIAGDAWYPSIDAARDFGLVLATRLQDIEGVSWVERTDIEKAELELWHQASGVLSPTNGIRLGQWVKADLLVTGNLTLDEGLGRELVIAVLDARRGDELATRRMRLRQMGGLPFAPTEEHLQAAAKAARESLEEARLRLAAADAQQVFAPLFIGNRTAHTSRLDSKIAGIFRSIQRGAKGKPARVLNLQGSGLAAQEADLAISGLTLGDGGAWRDVADHYLWGWCEETGDASTPYAEMPVRLVFELWSGGAETKTFSVDAKLPDLESAAEKLAAQIFSNTLALPRPHPTDEDRLFVARRLLAHARELISKEPESMRLDDGNPWLVTRWLLTMRTLAAARFFSPEDPEIAATWLLERWYDDLLFPRSAERVTASSVEVFWNLWQRKRDWDEHVAKFDLNGLRQVAQSIRRNNKTLFSVFQTPKDAPLDWHFQVNQELFEWIHKGYDGMPDGLPTTTRRQWAGALAAATADCFVRAHAERTERTHYRPSFMSNSLEFYLPLEKRLEIANTCWKLLNQYQTDPNPAKILEERGDILRWFDEAGQRSQTAAVMKLPARFFSDAYQGAYLPWISPPENPAPDVIEPSPSPPKPPASKRIRVPMLPVALPEAWQSPTIMNAVSVGAFGVIALKCELGGEEQTVVATWVPETNKFEVLAPLPARIAGDIDFLIHSRDSIWMGGPVYGASKLDFGSKQFTRFTDTDGIPFSAVTMAAAVGNEVYVAGRATGNKPMVAAWSASKGWKIVPLQVDGKPLPVQHILHLAASGSRLYGCFQTTQNKNELMILDTASGSWRPLAGLRSATGVISGLWADERGAWVLETDALTLVSEHTHANRSIRFPEDIRINVNVPSGVHDGEWLWITGQELVGKVFIPGQRNTFCRLLAFHKPTATYRGCIDIAEDATMVGLVVTPDALFPLIHKVQLEGPNPPSIFKLDRNAVIQAISQ